MLAISLALALLNVPSAQAAPPQFHCVVLQGADYSLDQVFDINALGEAVGAVYNSVGFPTAAYWNADAELTFLGRENAAVFSSAQALNAAGWIVGWGGQMDHPVPLRWTVAAGGRPIPGQTPGMAIDVNEGGDILLVVGVGSSGLLLKRDGSSAAIPFSFNSSIRGLSDDRRVSGNRSMGPCRWSEASGFENLEIPLGAFDASAWGISSDGVSVAGQVDFGVDKRAAIWNFAGLAQILPDSTLQTHNALAVAVNASGWAVGRRYGTLPGHPQARDYATLWADGVAYELEDLIQSGPSAEMVSATAINDGGQIVGQASVNGSSCLIRLDPL